MAQIEKVTIEDKNPRGYKNINKCDFDEKKHKIYKGKKRSEEDTASK